MFWTEGEGLECHIKEARRLASTTQYDLFGALSCLELAVSLQSFSPLCLWKKSLACFSSFFSFHLVIGVSAFPKRVLCEIG